MNIPNTASSLMNISLVPKTSACYLDLNPTYSGSKYNTGKTHLDPFWPIDLWANKWPDLLSQFDAITSPKFSLSQLNPWKEKDDKFVYETELPRFKANSLDITTENGVLHISAEQDSLKYYNSVNLPQNADVETVDAKLDHGVLYISISKLASAKTKKIKVQTVK